MLAFILMPEDCRRNDVTNEIGTANDEYLSTSNCRGIRQDIQLRNCGAGGFSGLEAVKGRWQLQRYGVLEEDVDPSWVSVRSITPKQELAMTYRVYPYLEVPLEVDLFNAHWLSQ